MSRKHFLSLVSRLFSAAMSLAVIMPVYIVLPRASHALWLNERMVFEPPAGGASITSASWNLVTVRGPVIAVPIDIFLNQELPAYSILRGRIELPRMSEVHSSTIYQVHRSLTLGQTAPEFPVEKQELEEKVNNYAPAALHSFSSPVPRLPTTTELPLVLSGKALVVDQDAQVLRVYEDGVEIRTLPASTGVPPLYTPAFSGYVGRYASTIYGYGELADNAWYVFTAGGNIYIHSAPYTLSEDEKVYEGLEFLGVRPSSHGCIRLHPADAEWLTTWNPQGVPILITPLDLSKEW